MRKMVLIVLTVAAILIVATSAAGCSNTPKVSNPPVTSAPSRGPGPSPASTPAAGTASPTSAALLTAHVGSTVAITNGDGMKENVKLVAVIDPAQGADRLAAPISGYRFVGVEVTIADTGSGDASRDANSDLAVVGSNNQTYQASFGPITECKNFADGVYTLAPGHTSSGCDTFEVPTGVSVVKVMDNLGGVGSPASVVGQWDVP
jgi:Domain of unknown function (DUF4352)